MLSPVSAIWAGLRPKSLEANSVHIMLVTLLFGQVSYSRHISIIAITSMGLLVSAKLRKFARSNEDGTVIAKSENAMERCSQAHFLNR